MAELSRTSAIGDAAVAVLAERVAAIRAQEPLARAGDPEGVHDFRVAIRRTRAAIAVFADVLPARAQQIRARLRSIGSAFGAVRDVDVAVAWLESVQGDEDAEHARAMLDARRAAAFESACTSLAPTRLGRALTASDSLIRTGAIRRQAARVPVAEAAPEIVSRAYRRVRAAGDTVTAASTAPELHRLRIRCKRLRYTAEAFRSIYGKQAESLIERAIDLQDALGDQHDADVTTALFRSLALEESTARAFALGRLAEARVSHALRARAGFTKTYRSLVGKRWHRLQRAMEQPIGDTQEDAG